MQIYLNRAIRSIMSSAKCSLVVDTVVFLHYPPIAELRLHELLQTDSITLLFPLVIIQELEKHKDSHRNKRVRERAREALKAIKAAISGHMPFGNQFHSEFLNTDVTETLTSFGLDPLANDNRIVAVAHQHANGHLSSNSRIVVLSQNTAVQLICQSLGIESVELDESLRIPEELDELEKELRTTKSELAKLRNALPSLNIGFANGDVLLQHANFEIRDTSPLAESEIESEIARVSDKFPVFDRSSNGPRLRAKEITRAAVIQSVVDYSRMHEVSPSEVARYNGERQKLIEEYPQYMRNCNDYEREKNLTIEILLEIRNDGTAVADDVDVLLYFPDGFEILTEKQLGANPVAPREPRLRRTMTEELQESIKSVPYLRSDIMRAMMPRIEPPTSLHVERTNSFRVTDHFPNIKHGMQVKLPTLYAVFDSVESANSFECTYELRPANLPVPVTAKLHFIVQKN